MPYEDTVRRWREQAGTPLGTSSSNLVPSGGPSTGWYDAPPQGSEAPAAPQVVGPTLGVGEQGPSYPQRISPMQSPYRFQQEMGPAYFGIGGLQGRKKKQQRSATGNFWNQIGGGQGAAYQGQLAPMVNQGYQRVTGLFSQGGSQFG